MDDVQQVDYIYPLAVKNLINLGQIQQPNEDNYLIFSDMDKNAYNVSK